MENKVQFTKDIVNYLENTHKNYLVDTKSYVQPAYKMKCLGGMEVMLVILGVIPSGGSLTHMYESIPRKMWILGCIPWTFSQKENYEEFILRLVSETIHNAKTHGVK